MCCPHVNRLPVTTVPCQPSSSHRVNRANRDNGILGSELQYLESRLAETTKAKDTALQKVTASREVFENELQDLEKLMRRKAKQRQKAIKENELAQYGIESDSDDDDGGGVQMSLEDGGDYSDEEQSDESEDEYSEGESEEDSEGRSEGSVTGSEEYSDEEEETEDELSDTEGEYTDDGGGGKRR